MDSWHYKGNKQRHSWELGKNFINKCKLTLKKDQNLPIEVGDTGYIHLKSSVTLPKYVWTEDKYNRFVCILGNILIFQRYQEGEILMYGKIIPEEGINNDFSETVKKQNLNEWEKLLK